MSSTSWSAACETKSIGHSNTNCCRRFAASGMSSGRSTFGLRLAFWYAAVFIVSAMAIIAVTYYLAASSLAQRDRQILRSKVGEYATAYARGGFGRLTATVRAEQAVAPER